MIKKPYIYDKDGKGNKIIVLSFGNIAYIYIATCVDTLPYLLTHVAYTYSGKFSCIIVNNVGFRGIFNMEYGFVG